VLNGTITLDANNSTAIVYEQYMVESVDFSFADGEAQKIVEFPVYDDTYALPPAYNGMASMIFYLGEYGSGPTATVTFVDDDPGGMIGIFQSDQFRYVYNETDGNGFVLVMLSRPVSEDVTYRIVSIHGTALAGVDYAPINEERTILAGNDDDPVIFSIPANPETTTERYFTVRIVWARGAQLINSEVRVYIRDSGYVPPEPTPTPTPTLRPCPTPVPPYHFPSPLPVAKGTIYPRPLAPNNTSVFGYMFWYNLSTNRPYATNVSWGLPSIPLYNMSNRTTVNVSVFGWGFDLPWT
jgi:hypothetical protein